MAMERVPPADPADLEALRAAQWIVGDTVAAGDLFDRVRTGPDPEGAMHRLGEVARRSPDLVRDALEDAVLGKRLVSLVGGSRALAATLATAEDARRILLGPPMLQDALPEDLGRLVPQALAAIAAEDLADEIDMPEAGLRIANLADAAARVAASTFGNLAIAVVAMGKWGGGELNYASDIDVLFVHEGPEDEAADAATRFIELLTRRADSRAPFRVDTDLRPEGSAGPLTRSLDSYRAYWERWADTWEFQALLKARFVAGDPALGARFLEVAEEYVFPQRLGADAVRSVRAMKARAEGLLDPSVTELKRGVGGIRDVEFAVQLLQLVHGRADPSLRTPNTLEALEALADGGYVLGDDADELAAAYRWLRDAEHRIQLFDLRQTHSLPTQPADRERVARAMGYRDDPNTPALERFESDLAERRSAVRSIHERLFHRPVLEALADSRAASMTPEAAIQRLEAFGFLDTDGTRRAVAELTTGLSRRSALMRHMLPVVMEWLSTAPDPDLGLAQLRLLLGTTDDTAAIVATLRDDPAAAERLCLVLGTSSLVGRLIDRLPPLVPTLGDDAALASWPASDNLVAEAGHRVSVHDDPTAALRRFHAEHLLRIAVADIAGLIDEAEVGRRLSQLSDATVAAAVSAAATETGEAHGLCVVALGKWGGGELTYASDLDAIVVVDEPDATDRASRIIERVIATLGGPITGLPSLELDLDLRPEGRKGALVRSASAYEAYWEQWVETWELQALLRARPAVGDIDRGTELVATAARYVFADIPDRDQDIRAMKARVERERIPLEEDPDFHLKLGKGSLADVEWTVQLLQMRHGRDRPAVRGPSTLRAIKALAREGILPADEAKMLAEAYRFCARVRNRQFLRSERGFDSLPSDPAEATRLARSLGYDSSPRSALREDYRRLTRRARRVVERRFYGIDPGS